MSDYNPIIIEKRTSTVTAGGLVYTTVDIGTGNFEIVGLSVAVGLYGAVTAKVVFRTKDEHGDDIDLVLTQGQTTGPYRPLTMIGTRMIRGPGKILTVAYHTGGSAGTTAISHELVVHYRRMI